MTGEGGLSAAARAVLLALLSSPAPALAEARSVKPISGNPACAYPLLAESNLVAGPVLFVAQVRPDGRVKSVDVRRVPAKGLGFEGAVRDCVRRWRFEPAVGKASLRQYEGEIRFRIAASDETSVRVLLEAFAAAWNARNAEGIGALAGTEQQRELTRERAAADWNMELEPAFQHIQFLRPDVAVVRQPFYEVKPAGAEGPEKKRSSLLEATARKTGDSWTLLAWYPLAGPPVAERWLFPGIEEPRKVKHVDPVYPDPALRTPVSAIVTLEALVDASGHVAAVKVLRGSRLFDDAAMRAVRQWEYAPTLLAGVPIPIVIRVDVPFDVAARCPSCAAPAPAVP